MRKNNSLVKTVVMIIIRKKYRKGKVMNTML